MHACLPLRCVGGLEASYQLYMYVLQIICKPAYKIKAAPNSCLVSGPVDFQNRDAGTRYNCMPLYHYSIK